MEHTVMWFYVTVIICILFENSLETYTLKRERNRVVDNLKHDKENSVHKETLDSILQLGPRDENKKIPIWKEVALKFEEYPKKALTEGSYNPTKHNKRLKRMANQRWPWFCTWCAGAKSEVPGENATQTETNNDEKI